MLHGKRTELFPKLILGHDAVCAGGDENFYLGERTAVRAEVIAQDGQDLLDRRVTGVVLDQKDDVLLWREHRAQRRTGSGCIQLLHEALFPIVHGLERGEVRFEDHALLRQLQRQQRMRIRNVICFQVHSNLL